LPPKKPIGPTLSNLFAALRSIYVFRHHLVPLSILIHESSLLFRLKFLTLSFKKRMRNNGNGSMVGNGIGVGIV